MKKGMTIFALTTILCGAAAITENHNQAFARSGSHSSGHSANSGRSSHSSGHSASSGRSSHSSGHSASSGRSSHSSGHSASSGRSSHSSGHSANSGRSSSSKGHSATAGRSSSSKGHSATVGRNSSSKGHSATVGRNSNTKGHGAVASKKSNSKGKNTKGNRNSKPSNVATKGKGSNTKTAVNNKNNKLNTAKNNNKKLNALNNKTNVKGKATNHKNQSLTSKKGNNSKTSKVTKNNKKNSNKTNLVSKRNQNKKGAAANSKKNNKNLKNNKLATKGKVVNPKKKTNLTPKVATKKYKTKEEISRLSTWSILKYVYQHRNGSKINELHGCYCGPFFGDTKKGPKPVDILDRLCRQHDIGYEKKGYFNRQVNNEFIAGVNKYASKMKPAEREKAYYFAEGFKRMNNTPLQEVAKAFNLASKPFTAVANFISNGAKSIGNLFNGNRTSTINKNSNNFDRGGSNGKNSYPWLKKPRVAR